jgi:hypothetical protein
MDMRTIVIALSTALLAGAAFAQEPATQTTPAKAAKQSTPAGPAKQTTPADYSRPTLMRLFVIDPQTGPPTPSIEQEVGAVRVRSRFANVLIGYLPFFAPFPGSVPTTTRQMVDPFVMTHMEIPAGPRVMARERARELRRIERLTREPSRTPDTTTATVKVATP